MIAYKLVTKRKDGSLGPLFIGRSRRLCLGQWLDAEDLPTKGYAHRPGWHCCQTPEAPHLKQEGRTWVKVEIRDYVRFPRPKHQDGEWLISQRMKILEVL